MPNRPVDHEPVAGRPPGGGDDASFSPAFADVDVANYLVNAIGSWLLARTRIDSRSKPPIARMTSQPAKSAM
jgi:hypothetical protein